MKLRNTFFILIGGITIVFLGLLFWKYHNDEIAIQKFAKIEAFVAFQKDLQYRKWVAIHGGVYAPISEYLQPNPHLDSVPERDITTNSGRTLTLVNPAYMTRQVHELFENENVAKGHITSLKPIRGLNKPFDWEIEALKSFEKGSDEYVEPVIINNEKYLRFMRPIITEQTCLKCHEHQGYKIGDIRGGISITVPMQKYEEITQRSKYTFYAIITGIYLLIISLGIVWFKRLKSEIANRSVSQQMILESEALLKQQIEEYLSLNEELLESHSQIRKMNEDLKKALNKAEESDNLKSAFIRNISHEIRTPLNGIIGFSEMLQNSNITDEKRNQFSKLVVNNSYQLLDVVNDILEISMIETKMVNLNIKTVYLNSLLDDIYLCFKVQADKKNLSIQLIKPLSDTEAGIETDKEKFRQIFYYLLGNAIKFTHQGHIRFGYTVENGFINFFVEDTGIGISPENHSTIFNRFHQVDYTTTRNYGGTGIGLSICKAYVELLNGKILVESEIGKGSKFIFILPVKFTPVVADKIKPKVPATNVQHTILIVEDEEVNFLYLKEIINSQFYKLYYAQDGKKAIEFCKSYPEIELVLMDLKMPVLDGIEATKVIHKLRPELPIIAQTAYTLSDDRKKALEAGCVDYLTKPIRINEIDEILSRYFGKQ